MKSATVSVAALIMASGVTGTPFASVTKRNFVWGMVAIEKGAVLLALALAD